MYYIIHSIIYFLPVFFYLHMSFFFTTFAPANEYDVLFMKRFFPLLAFALLPLMVQAQWRVGASGGADYNWFTINKQYMNNYHYDGVWGWNAAVFGQYNFMNWLGLRFELEASERSHRVYRDGVSEGTNYINHNTYLQLPVLAQFSFGGEKVRGFLHAGVFAGYWLAGRQKGTFFDWLTITVYPVDAPYNFQTEKDQRWDFGLAGGIGVEYRFLEHWAMHVEGRCYYSFISTVKPYMEHVKDNRYNTTIGMNLGFCYIF